MSARAPPHEFHNVGRGWCRFCGGVTLLPDDRPAPRRNWHPECVHIWKIASSSDYARRVVWDRDHGICAGCGVDTATLWAGWTHGPKLLIWLGVGAGVAEYQKIEPRTRWELDHRTPLWRVDRAAFGAFWYWTLDNLQTLCSACHAEKTRREARERAQAAPENVA